MISELRTSKGDHCSGVLCSPLPFFAFVYSDSLQGRELSRPSRPLGLTTITKRSDKTRGDVYTLRMGHPAGVTLDRVKLERRRLQAARLLQKGVSEAEVARRVGVHRQSVNRWAQQLAEGGREALKRAPRTGRPPQLSAGDVRRIEQGLKRGPEALGYRTSLWTAWRVADLD